MAGGGAPLLYQRRAGAHPGQGGLGLGLGRPHHQREPDLVVPRAELGEHLGVRGRDAREHLVLQEALDGDPAPLGIERGAHLGQAIESLGARGARHGHLAQQRLECREGRKAGRLGARHHLAHGDGIAPDASHHGGGGRWRERERRRQEDREHVLRFYTPAGASASSRALGW